MEEHKIHTHQPNGETEAWASRLSSRGCRWVSLPCVAFPCKDSVFPLCGLLQLLMLLMGFTQTCGGKNINSVVFLSAQLIKQFCILLKRNHFLDSKLLRNFLFQLAHQVTSCFFLNWTRCSLETWLWLKGLGDLSGWDCATQHWGF